MTEYEVWESHICFTCRGIYGGPFVHAEPHKTESLSSCDTEPMHISAETADEAIRKYEDISHSGAWGVAPSHWNAGHPERVSRRTA